MEFLFWNQIASFEAITVLLCVALIWAIFLYDGYLFIARLIGVLTPRKEYIKEKSIEDVSTPEVPPITLEEIEEVIEKEQLSWEWETRKEEGTAVTSPEISENKEEEILQENISGDTENNAHTITNTPHTVGEEWLLSSTETPDTDDAKSDKNVLEMTETDTTLVEGDGSIGESEAREISEVPWAMEPLIQEEQVEEVPEAETTEQSVIEQNDEQWIEQEIPEELVNTIDTLTPTTEEKEIESNDEDTSAIEDLRVEDVLREASPKEEIASSSEDEDTYTPPPKRVVQEAPKNTVPTQPQISPEKRDKLVEITNNVRTLIARGHIIDARTLIIEWLSISKNHRDLNIILAELYERDHAFEKAEFIYKDLAHFYPDDAELIMHLANTLAMQHKYRVSYELYKKVLSLAWETEEILYTLTHLASELWETDDTYEYARIYTKQYPKNPEILWLLSQSQIATDRRKDAIETLIKLKNLTPYSQEIVDLIGKLVTEEEMAGNFGGEK